MKVLLLTPLAPASLSIHSTRCRWVIARSLVGGWWRQGGGLDRLLPLNSDRLPRSRGQGERHHHRHTRIREGCNPSIHSPRLRVQRQVLGARHSGPLPLAALLVNPTDWTELGELRCLRVARV